MKALFLKEAKKFEFQDISLENSEEKITIKVKALGICGSEISAYKGVFPLGIFPRTLGHELAGEVVYAPENAKGVVEGDHVVLEPYVYCGKCYPCSVGKTNACENLEVIGVHRNGGYMEYYAHDKDLVHKIPKDMPFEYGAMVEPLTISLHGVHRANVKAGESVVITGAGAIGILAAQYVKYLGAVPIVIDPLDKRLELCKGLGIDHIINPSRQNAVDEIREMTGGRMAEALVEASGAVSAIKSAIDYVAYTGKVSLVGYSHGEIPLPTFMFTKKELDVNGSRNSANEFPLAIDLIDKGAIDVKAMITNLIDFEEMPAYFEKITNTPSEFIKVIAKL